MRSEGPSTWSLLALAMVGCASTAPTGHVAVEPTPAESMMLTDLVHPHAGGTSPEAAALLIGGARDEATLASLLQSLSARLDAIVRALPAEPRARGRALLAALFDAKAGRPLLERYEPGATTLYDVVTTGRFNCVSATTLYLLAARRAGLDVRPVLLPSHARAVAIVGSARVVVETTTRNGYDAPDAVLRQAQDRARPKGGNRRDLYADEKGTEVDWNALLAVTYGNLAIVAQDRGDTTLASSLLAREAALTPPAQADVVRTQQVSLLTELATRAADAHRFDDALTLGRRAADTAPDATTQALTQQNLAAIASAQLLAEESRMTDAALLAFADRLRDYPAASGDVRAIALTTLGERKLRRGDVEGSAADLREAAKVARSASVRGQAGHNALLGEINRLATLSTTDPEAAWVAWEKLAPDDPTLREVAADAARLIQGNRAIKFANAGRCPELETHVEAIPDPAKRDTLRAGCHERHGLALADRLEFASAIDELRIAVRLEPTEPRHASNLIAIIEKEVDRLLHAHQCDRASPLIAEGQKKPDASPFFEQAAALCRTRSP